MPVFNDWEAAAIVYQGLQEALREPDQWDAQVVLADDGSTAPFPAEQFAGAQESGIGGAWLLTLQRNLGHQRALAIGLAQVQARLECDYLVVMDSDGEDRPADVPRLVLALEQSDAAVVFAERGRRYESALFKSLWWCYRMLHHALTGVPIRFGNFSALRWPAAASLLVVPELWNHFAASIVRARLPYRTLRADRGVRAHGQSKMNLISLILHGLSAVAAFHETISVRFLLAGVLGSAVFGGVVALWLALMLTQGWRPASWALALLVLGIILASQVLLLAAGIVFFALFSRNSLGFLAVRDYAYFVRSFEPVGGRRDTSQRDRRALPGQ